MKALGADEVITINETDVEKELEMHDKYESSWHNEVDLNLCFRQI